MRILRPLLLVLLLPLLAACATLAGRDPLRVDVAGLDTLPGEGLELRLAVKLRVQNPNDAPLAYDGAALDLQLDGRTVASGVSNVRGSVPRYGEALITVPVSVSMLDVARVVAVLGSTGDGHAPTYAVRGKLGHGRGSHRFRSEGRLDELGGRTR